MGMVNVSKADVKAGEYTSKAGALVKTWDLAGLHPWKTYSIPQGEEVECAKVLKIWLSQIERMAGLRLKLDEAQTRLNAAKKSRDAFLVIFAKYPEALAKERAAEDAAVAAAEESLKAITATPSQA